MLAARMPLTRSSSDAGPKSCAAMDLDDMAARNYKLGSSLY